MTSVCPSLLVTSLVPCAVTGAELALKPSLNAKLVPSHARLMDTSSNSAESGVPASADVPGAGASSSVG